jgi:hypothetical protein
LEKSLKVFFWLMIKKFIKDTSMNVKVNKDIITLVYYYAGKIDYGRYAEYH